MTAHRFLRSVFVLSLGFAAATLSPSPASAGDDDADGGHAWPFGLSRGGSAMLKGLDLYNLGPLGLKVRDAATPLPSRTMTTGRQSFSADGDPAPADLGPEALAVEMLFPGGPAAKAKLRRGDVLVGVNGKPFAVGSLGSIADAIKAAESGATKGVVSFSVRRGGAAEPVTVDVTLPVRGKEWATPLVGKPREALVEAACKWLAERQESGGLAEQTMSGANGATVQASLAGLCWLAAGSDLAKGRYAKNVKGAYAIVAGHLGAAPEPGPGGRSRAAPGTDGPGGDDPSGASWDQSNWRWVHAALFLGELQPRSSSAEVKSLLMKCGAEISQRQEKSGGWAHGPGGPNALGYLELNIVSVLAMQGLGMSARAGYEVPPEVLRKGRQYLEESCHDDGVAYSGNADHHTTGNIGRTAGAWLGCLNLGLREDPLALRFAQYIRKNAGDVFGGHASLMQHYLLGGVGAQALGLDPARDFWAVCERDMILARAPDGSFQPRPWHESIKMSSNTDVGFGEVWTTAAWTLVLAAQPVEGVRPGLPVWTGVAGPPKPKK